MPEARRFAVRLVLCGREREIPLARSLNSTVTS